MTKSNGKHKNENILCYFDKIKMQEESWCGVKESQYFKI
jgi:hypothetical protein